MVINSIMIGDKYGIVRAFAHWPYNFLVICNLNISFILHTTRFLYICMIVVEQMSLADILCYITFKIPVILWAEFY